MRNLLTSSSRFTIKALSAGVLFAGGIVSVFAYLTLSEMSSEKASGEHLSTNEWNTVVYELQNLKLQTNGMADCTEGQIIQKKEDSWDCVAMPDGSGGGDSRLVEICNITTCEGNPGTDEYVVVGTQTWSCCNSSLGNGVPVGDAYNGKFYSVGNIFEACTGEWEVPTRDDFVTLDGDINRMALPKLGVRADNGTYLSHDVSYLWTSTFQDIGANNGDRVSYAKNGTVDKTIPGEISGMSYQPPSTVPESAGYQFHIRCIKK